MLFQKEYITGSLMPRIQELWQSAECTFPPFLTKINAGEKGTNEKWITESTENGSDKISLTIMEKEE